MGSLHVGLIGCGRWGQILLRDLKALGARVSVVARSAASITRAESGGADLVVRGSAHLPDVRAVYVATTIATHAEVIESVLDRGVPIFCEKPLTDDPDHAESLAARAADRLFVLDKWRYHPGVEEIGRIARSGELGPAIGLTTRRVGWGNGHPDSSAPWVLAPHDLAIALEVLGCVLPLRGAVLDCLGGRVAGVTALMAGAHAWHSMEVSERSPERVRSIRLLCRDGGVTLGDPYADHLSIFRLRVGDTDGPLEPERRPIATDWPLPRLLAATLRFVEGGPAPKTAAAEAATIVRRLSQMLVGNEAAS